MYQQLLNPTALDPCDSETDAMRYARMYYHLTSSRENIVACRVGCLLFDPHFHSRASDGYPFKITVHSDVELCRIYVWRSPRGVERDEYLSCIFPVAVFHRFRQEEYELVSDWMRVRDAGTRTLTQSHSDTMDRTME